MTLLLRLDASQVAVLAGGVVSIALILWYFFGERERTVAVEKEGGVQEVKITVKGGYSPDVTDTAPASMNTTMIW
jgi:Cu+-exporting ATPase